MFKRMILAARLAAARQVKKNSRSKAEGNYKRFARIGRNASGGLVVANLLPRRLLPACHKASILFLSLALVISTAAFGANIDHASIDQENISSLLAKAQREGFVRVVVGMRMEPVPGPPASARSAVGASARRQAVSQARSRVLTQLNPADFRNLRALNYLPYVALEVNPPALQGLSRHPGVASITPDILYRTTLSESSPLIGADIAWAAGFGGEGEIIAVLDTGVDRFHPFLAGKVVSEACYSTTNVAVGSQAFCAAGSVAPGSGMPCSLPTCDHGTHVAGIAAGNGPSAGVGFSGVARDAGLVAIQVFSQFNDPAVCNPSPAPCELAFLSDIVAGLDRVFELKTTNGLNIVSANLSLGGPNFSSQTACDANYPAMTDAVALLRTAGVATVAASGNDGDTFAINHPACITGAVAVGATTKTDTVPFFSNSSQRVDLLAPGVSIFSSVPGSGFDFKSGTSMSTPQAAGAWAVVMDNNPTASVTTVEQALQDTGVPITDTRNGIVKPRIQVDAALSLAPDPGDLTITLSADNASEVYVNGVLQGTTNDWRIASVFTIPLQAGPNVIAIKGIDAGSVAGILAELAWGQDQSALTGTSWRVSPTAPIGWESVGFDDRTWLPATSYGFYGVAPWLDRVSGFPPGSIAEWIWTADNQNDDTAFARFTITVGSAPLTVDTTALPNATVDQAYQQSVLASGGTPPYTWSLANATSLPAGLVLDPDTGVIHGTPLAEEIASFTVQVQDSAGGLDTQDLTINVGPAPPPQLDITLSADNASEVYINGLLQGTTDDWQTAGSFSKMLQPGPNVIAIKGIDAGGVAGLLAELVRGGTTIVTDTSWKVSPTAPPGWESIGFDDSAWLPATSYGVYGVSPWLERVSGFPVNSVAHWIWTADNSDDNTAFARYMITLGSAPLAVDTTTLPDATVGQGYQQTLLASGGTPPFTWSLGNGTQLPAGLSLDSATGVIFGTPTTVESGSFTVQVQDSAASLDTQDLTLNVTAPPPDQITITLSADNASDVYVNGVPAGSTSDWFEAGVFTGTLQSGANVIAIRGTDAGGVAGLLVELVWGGGTAVSDASWKVSPTAPAGWETIGFDDSPWAAATSYGAYGVSPWLKRVSGFPDDSTAQWIWTVDNYSDDIAFARFTINLP